MKLLLSILGLIITLSATSQTVYYNLYDKESLYRDIYEKMGMTASIEIRDSYNTDYMLSIDKRKSRYIVNIYYDLSKENMTRAIILAMLKVSFMDAGMFISESDAVLRSEQIFDEYTKNIDER